MKKNDQHEWDGITEEDHPVPMWLKLMCYFTVLFFIRYIGYYIPLGLYLIKKEF